MLPNVALLVRGWDGALIRMPGIRRDMGRGDGIVFGLTDDRLRPVIEAAVGQPIASFTTTVGNEVPGYYGFSAEKLIPTFDYEAASGETGEVTVFAKRFHRTGAAEAHHYSELSRHGAPIPRMYGALSDREGREVLFLEYLEPLPDEEAFVLDDPGRLRKWLALVARFGAVKPSPEWVREHGQTGAEWADGLREAREAQSGLWRRALPGGLGSELEAFCREHEEELFHLHALVDAVADRTADMPMTLAHRDICPENAGRRLETDEWLVLDIEWIGLAPRFFDAACWLGAPDDVRPRCLPREELARTFLAKWQDLTDERVPVGEFLETTHDLWVASQVNVDWMVGRALDGVTCWTEDRDEGRRWFRAELLRALRILVREARSEG